MSQTPLPNTGMNFEHTLGVDDWKNSYDTNWVIADWGAQPFVIDHLITAEPGVPAVGDAYILGATRTGTNWGSDTNSAEDSVAIYTNVPGQTDGSPWYYMVPREGWTLYDRTNNRWFFFDGTNWIGRDAVAFQLALSDLTTALTTGDDKAYFRAPFPFTITAARASLLTASDSGAVDVDIENDGTSIFTTTLTIDVSELTSQTAATPAVLDSAEVAVADDAPVTFNIDGAGNNAAGLIVTILGYRT